MKAIGITCTVMLSALLGIAALSSAAQAHPGEKQNHSQQQNSHGQANPQPQHVQNQQHAQQSRQEQSRPQQQHAQQQQHTQQQHAQPQAQRQQTNRAQQQRAQQERGNGHIQRSPQQRGAEQRVWQEHRAGNWQSDHRTWQQRGGYRGYRIPDGRFRGYFGRNHWFRIGGLPFMVEGGYPRFQYQGYWFSLLDPWPANWGNGWYNNDDVYVDYVDNGYYLFNRGYPGMGIAISISM
jgi:hypothetical protein